MLAPHEDDRIQDRRLIGNLPRILATIRGMLESSEVIARAQMERDRRSKRQYYSVIDLFLSYVVMLALGMGYDEVRHQLQDAYCEAIGLPRDPNGEWRRPSGSTICEFRRDVVDRISDELSMEIAVAMMDRVDVVRRGQGYIVVSIDSTPAQASRYDFDAEYNGHYRIRMDKMHIIMIDGHPLFMVPTDGNVGDNVPARELLARFGEAMSRTGLEGDDLKLMADGAYDSFRTFVDAYSILGLRLRCRIRDDAVIHEEASWPAVQARYCGMHRERGYDPHRKNDEAFVLHFLERHGERELVGMYLRDRELERMRGQISDGVRDTDRSVCEVVHHSMKAWIDCSTVKIRHRTRHIVLKSRFLVVQLLSLAFKGYVDIDTCREGCRKPCIDDAGT